MRSTSSSSRHRRHPARLAAATSHRVPDPGARSRWLSTAGGPAPPTWCRSQSPCWRRDCACSSSMPEATAAVATSLSPPCPPSPTVSARHCVGCAANQRSTPTASCSWGTRSEPELRSSRQPRITRSPLSSRSRRSIYASSQSALSDWPDRDDTKVDVDIGPGLDGDRGPGSIGADADRPDHQRPTTRRPRRSRSTHTGWAARSRSRYAATVRVSLPRTRPAFTSASTPQIMPLARSVWACGSSRCWPKLNDGDIAYRTAAPGAEFTVTLPV